jgi:hypothetical protein
MTSSRYLSNKQCGKGIDCDSHVYGHTCIWLYVTHPKQSKKEKLVRKFAHHVVRVFARLVVDNFARKSKICLYRTAEGKLLDVRTNATWHELPIGSIDVMETFITIWQFGTHKKTIRWSAHGRHERHMDQRNKGRDGKFDGVLTHVAWPATSRSIR